MDTEKTQNQLAQLLHTAGYKYTKPRRAVAQVLLENRRHLTAPEIVDAVATLDPSVGRMSVYRTLDLFTRLGLIRPIFQGSMNARYAIMVGGHHHHLVCETCGAVIHFDDCPLEDLKKELETRYDFVIDGHLLEFFGHCNKCHAE